jgi:hypothetical protein
MCIPSQIVTAGPIIIVTIPSTLKPGISVLEGSPAIIVSSGQASVTTALGPILPWSFSPGPCDAPSIAYRLSILRKE